LCYFQYLYANKFDVKTGEEAGEVLYLANKYNTKYLEPRCSAILETEINTGNAMYLHSIALQVNQLDLESDTLNFITK